MKVFVNVIISRYPQVQSCEYTNGLQLKLLPHKGAFGGPETVQKSSSKVKIFDNKLARYSMFSQCYEPIHVTSTNELLGCDYDIMHLQNAPRRKLLYSDYQYNCIIGFSYADWSAFPSDRKSITGYCVFFGANLVSWKSKMQPIISKSSAKSTYNAMAHLTCKLICIQNVLIEMGFV